MLRRFDQRDKEQGETLLEIVIALAILSVVVISVFASIALGIRVSGLHRNEVNASAYLKSYAEAIEADVASGGYANNTCSPNYGSSFTSTFNDPNFSTPTISAVSYWNVGTNSFPGSCATNTYGLQQLTLQISTVGTANSPVTEKLVIVVRTTCSSGQSC